MLKLLICTLFLIQSIQSQTNNQVNIEGSVIKNSNFFEVKLCDSKYNDVSKQLTETLTTWKQVELQRFCQFQCSENICGFESDYKTMKKRQINNNVNINNSTITDSNFFEINVCSNSDFTEYEPKFNGVLEQILKDKLFPRFCKQEKETYMCKCDKKFKKEFPIIETTTQLLELPKAEVPVIVETTTHYSEEIQKNKRDILSSEKTTHYGGEKQKELPRIEVPVIVETTTHYGSELPRIEAPVIVETTTHYGSELPRIEAPVIVETTTHYGGEKQKELPRIEAPVIVETTTHYGGEKQKELPRIEVPVIVETTTQYASSN